MSRLIARIKDLLRNEKNVIEIELLEGGVKVPSLEVTDELEVSENGRLGDWLTIKIVSLIEANKKPYAQHLGTSAVNSMNKVGFTVPSEYRLLAGYYFLTVPAPASLGMASDCVIVIPYLFSQDTENVVGVIWDSNDSRAIVPISVSLQSLSTGSIVFASGDNSHVLKEGAYCSLAFLPVSYDSGG